VTRYPIGGRRRVPFVRPVEIESAAQRLLTAYAERFKVALAPPIPVDEILESHLELDLRFDNLPRLLTEPRALGATWVVQRRVRIDESLDPSVYPAMEGRYRFTLSHEVGHWELHRHLYLGLKDQGLLFGGLEQPSVICRAGERFDPQEWQANQFAGYLLMPRDMVIHAWQARRGDLEPYVAADEMADLSVRWSLGENETPTVEIARDLAREFTVSGQAMQIRLIGMGLIVTSKAQPSLFHGENTR
jgi:hypothetical protein